MIDEIQVQNLALIRDGSLAPSRGLTVLTGETGAGKTALLSAMKLLMGVRASADMVRDGTAGLTVSGRFVPRSASKEGDGEDAELVVTRRVSAEGRSRATIDGTMASAKEVAALVAPTIDLCGQFEHQQLMRAATHLALLDAWAGEAVAVPLTAYQQAYSQALSARRQLDEVKDAQQMGAAKLDEARFVLRRIDEAAPQEGEFEELQQELKLAEHGEALARAALGARQALSGEGCALDRLNEAAAALESVGAVDCELADLAQSLREASYVLEDVSAQVRDYGERCDFDPQALAWQQERFSQLQGLVRSFGPRMEDVFARREEAARTVALVDDFDASLHRAQQAWEQAESALSAAADVLDAARAQAAPQFAHEVSAVMAKLQMGDATLDCILERNRRDQWSTQGPSHFEFLYRPTAQSSPRPLARIASGGEVSRVMLALKVVLGATDGVDTLVFDEVDAGVGGAVAVALAEVLADLAQTHQVIVVTHLAQVAVRGDVHYVVQRTGDETSITSVVGEDREREIARMLAGSVTETSLAHARELLTQ